MERGNTVVSPEEQTSRIEGILEQINERQGTLERMIEERTSEIMRMLERKADRVEVRLYLAVNATLFAAILGLFGVLIAKL